MRRTSKKFLKIGILVIIANTVFAAFIIGQTDAQKAYEAYYLHLNDHPNDGAPSWGESNREAQGIAHDSAYWYITSTDIVSIPHFCPPCRLKNCLPCLPFTAKDCFLWKIPVGVDLDQDLGPNEQYPLDDPRHVSSIHLLGLPAIADTHMVFVDGPNDQLIQNGYTHWGDLDHYRRGQTDYLVVPATSSKLDPNLPSPVILVFRASDLTLVGYGKLPGDSKGAQNDVGWCAVDPNGYIFSSDDNTSILYRYEVNWDAFPVTGYIGQFLVSWVETETLVDGGSGTVLTLHNMQGGEFTPSGKLLYVSCGTGQCAFWGGDVFPNDGIHVFDVEGWREIRQSTNHDVYPFTWSSFDYHYNNDCSGDGSETAEGLTIWDLDNGRAPNICGQLHVLVAWVGAGFFDGGNRSSLEHFGRRIYVDWNNGTDPTDWTTPLPGTPSGYPVYGRPFKSLSCALNWLPAWNGAQIVIQAGSYPETGTFKTHVRLVSQGGTAIIGKEH